MKHIVCLVVLLFVAILPVYAQSRGMVSARGGMAPAGFGARSMSGFAPRAGGPMLGPRPGLSMTGRRTLGFTSTTGPFFHPLFNSFGKPLFRPRFGGCGPRGFCRGRFGFWPYAYGGYLYYPWDLDYGDYYNDYYNGNGYSNGNSDLQTALSQEQQLNAELMDQLREERMRSSEGTAETQARPEAPAAKARAAQPEPATPPTVLVFRDGSRQEVQNYALVGDTLYEFAGSSTRKIQLAQLDVPATVRVNDSRGVEFHLPSAH